MTAKCCMCKRHAERPAHEAIVEKRFNGWAPGRRFAKRQVWCESCWTELQRVNRQYHEDLERENARILAEHGLAGAGGAQ
jgi:hypothetical protein